MEDFIDDFLFILTEAYNLYNQIEIAKHVFKCTHFIVNCVHKYPVCSFVLLYKHLTYKK